MNDRAMTQRITAVDIAHGRIRIPIGQKDQFPPEKTTINIRLQGVFLPEVSWDPRFGPDRERSGVLNLGSQLAGLVTADERLGVINVGDRIEIGPKG